MKKLETVSLVIVVICIALAFFTNESHEILSKAFWIFAIIWGCVFRPLIVLVFFRKTPRAKGIVTDLSEGRIWGRTIVTVEFDFEGATYVIYENRNSGEAPALNTIVTVIVSRKNVSDSVFEEDGIFSKYSESF